MTAPLRGSEPIIVPVALGARAYEIVIGRGQLATLGARIKVLRAAAKCVVVTDENVAQKHLAPCQAALEAAGISSAVYHGTEWREI